MDDRIKFLIKRDKKSMEKFTEFKKSKEVEARSENLFHKENALKVNKLIFVQMNEKNVVNDNIREDFLKFEKYVEEYYQKVEGEIDDLVKFVEDNTANTDLTIKGRVKRI